MDLPKITDLNVSGKKVLVRLDLDTNPDPNDLRIKASEETLNFLREKGSEIVILAHKGRPGGKVVESLSLRPFQPIFDKWGARVEENLRFDSGEEANDPEFAKKLATLGEVYINEAFATSHRKHASIVGLPPLMPHAAGFRLLKEVENLTRVVENRQTLVTIIISGIKEDKVEMARRLAEIYDKVLVGGRLPDFMGDEKLISVRVRGEKDRLIIGNLAMDKEDITMHTITRFKEEIKKSGTLVLAGVLGKYEDEGHRQGTKEVFEAVANASAFKVAGGGDTELALKMFNLTDQFDWVSVGGGAMLEFLSKKTLPGIEALLQEG
jgi:phosphoglycerate kinase